MQGCIEMMVSNCQKQSSLLDRLGWKDTSIVKTAKQPDWRIVTYGAGGKETSWKGGVGKEATR